MQCVIGGDGISLSIAAASIVAKVVRDRLMERLGRRYPGYFWHTNAGYATARAPGGAANAGANPPPPARRSASVAQLQWC